MSSSEKKQVLSSLSADSQDVPQIQQTPVRLSVNDREFVASPGQAIQVHPVSRSVPRKLRVFSGKSPIPGGEVDF